jgi:hypothetical protein
MGFGLPVLAVPSFGNKELGTSEQVVEQVVEMADFSTSRLVPSFENKDLAVFEAK